MDISIESLRKNPANTRVIFPPKKWTQRRVNHNHGDKAFPGKGHSTELAALQRKLREVEMERDILKKAVGIFSKTTGNGSDS